jgi:ABC-type phosphate transport system substrate-binding protein
MKIAIWSVVLLATSIMWAQSDQPGSSPSASNSNREGSVTVRGCVSKLNGDYVLTKENPGNTYQLQGGKVRLKSYLGKRVEITGTESPTLSTSEDAINKTGNASPVTLAVKSIHTLAGECQSR